MGCIPCTNLSHGAHRAVNDCEVMGYVVSQICRPSDMNGLRRVADIVQPEYTRRTAMTHIESWDQPSDKNSSLRTYVSLSHYHGHACSVHGHTRHASGVRRDAVWIRDYRLSRCFESDHSSQLNFVASDLISGTGFGEMRANRAFPLGLVCCNPSTADELAALHEHRR
ncbi:uncharacterized protein BCR38DRAFT_429050 [Pseudomassariella vexata]|uniref:Uncharacterized protein n=1 Tax=Pseudomassariella vexata TaxID=1141098 RepID=A0A1Y2E3A2_9PEZI|nr:uncharacterized protein BCR38DRAFT_429050 [Pseudomassariella vexata]ORY66028.1 hypothetical protein BCR38DRAFT_429050 [Pseudomassariella vexata]